MKKQSISAADTDCFKSSSQDPTIESYWGGVILFTLLGICTSMKFRCKLFEPEADHVIDFKDYAALKALIDGTARVTLAPLLVNEKRYLSRRYSFILSPIQRTYSIVIHKRFLITDTSPLDLEEIMSAKVFCMWVAVVILISLVITLNHYLYKPAASGRTIIVQLICFFKLVVKGFFQRFEDEERQKRRFHHTGVIRIAVAAYLIFHLAFQNTFISNVPGKLIVSQRNALPFSSMEEFLLTDFELYGSMESSYVLQESIGHHMQVLGERMKGFPIIDKDFHKHMAADNGSVRRAFLLHDEDLWSLADVSCDFVVAVSKVMVVPVGIFWFRRSDPIREDFSVRYNWLSSPGLVSYDMDYYTEYMLSKFRRNRIPIKCIPKPIDGKENFNKVAVPLDLRNLWVVYAVFSGMAALTIVVFFAEISARIPDKLMKWFL